MTASASHTAFTMELPDGRCAKTAKVVSAMSAPETSGVLSHYRIGCHAV